MPRNHSIGVSVVRQGPSLEVVLYDADLVWSFSVVIARRVLDYCCVWFGGDGEGERMAPNERTKAKIEAIARCMQYAFELCYT